MASSSLFRLIFALYCAEAGIFLLTAPWLSAWDRLAYSMPWTDLRWILLAPLARSAVSAFGLIHLVWLAHDVDLYLRRRETISFAASTPSTPPAPTSTARGQ